MVRKFTWVASNLILPNMGVLSVLDPSKPIAVGVQGDRIA